MFDKKGEELNMNPREHVLLRLTKDQLMYKACEYRLVSAQHTKKALAQAIAKYEEDGVFRDMRAISKTRERELEFI